MKDDTGPQQQKPVVLCILDGWGCAPKHETNAISQARTPCWDEMIKYFPHTVLEASEESVGLPKGQMGNSEVGHMTIGCGRQFLQDLPRLTKAFKEGAAEQRPEFQNFINTLQKTGGTAHIMGLLSPGGVHSHQDHLFACLEILAHNKIPVAIHAFLDGRDTPPKSAQGYLQKLLNKIERFPEIFVATLGGRYFAMDRDQNWDRLQQAYNTIVHPQKHDPRPAEKIVREYYARNITDEFIPPHALGAYSGVAVGDGLLMVNFRSDRVRQLLRALLTPDFTHFDRKKTPLFSTALAMTTYADDLNPFIPALFPPETPQRCLGELLSQAGFKQLRVAETEKYAHVTFFFNGGREAAFPGEERLLVPSPSVATYDLKPEMSAAAVTEGVIKSLEKNAHDLIIVNFANTDMVGHTGNLQATIRAVETVDACLARLKKSVFNAGGTLLITADHGNAEQMYDPVAKMPHTAHTTNLVPFVCVSSTESFGDFSGKQGTLADIAPTILSLLDLPSEPLMTGESLVQKNQKPFS